MFREMRRKGQQLSREEAESILQRNTSGVLAVIGDEGYPYAVPLSYVYKDSEIYFHCAKVGHKLDAILKESRVSFCVIDQDQIVPEKFTTYFRSVIAFGRAHVIEDADEKRQAIEALAEKYSPGCEGRDQEIQGAFTSLCIIRMDIEHMTGKEARELRVN